MVTTTSPPSPEDVFPLHSPSLPTVKSWRSAPMATNFFLKLVVFLLLTLLAWCLTAV